MTLNNIMTSERSQIQKTTCGLILFIWMFTKEKWIEIYSKLMALLKFFRG